MALMSTFAPPSSESHIKILTLVQRLRCFDRNMQDPVKLLHVRNGWTRWTGEVATLFDPPRCNPHGEPWTLMSDAELKRAQQWAMRNEDHAALADEQARRDSMISWK